ncbi:MAG TPA: riboflavin synthase [Vicinamibacteria bacterium]|nr:riboflavin synthase [Vicinamibacteria bacterium]
MFTGLVLSLGRVAVRNERGAGLELEIENAAVAEELSVGASVAVSGVCLTATSVSVPMFRVDVAAETLSRTRLGRLPVGSAVNLELPLRASDRLGGHFVQGHVDEVGRIEHAGPLRENYILRVRLEKPSAGLVVEKGSIALDGVSLTVTREGGDWFEVMLIPHTLGVTTLGQLRARDEVHIEYDILAKYVLRLTGGRDESDETP